MRRVPHLLRDIGRLLSHLEGDVPVTERLPESLGALECEMEEAPTHVQTCYRNGGKHPLKRWASLQNLGKLVM